MRPSGIKRRKYLWAGGKTQKIIRRYNTYAFSRAPLSSASVFLFNDAVQHILILTSGYLSSCHLSVVSNQLSDLWPLTQTRHFSPHNCSSLDLFSFWDNYQKEERSINPGEGCDVVKIPEDQQFVNLMLTLNFSKYIIVAKSIELLPGDWLISYLCCQEIEHCT